jgi:hypothetical protein
MFGSKIDTYAVKLIELQKDKVPGQIKQKTPQFVKKLKKDAKDPDAPEELQGYYEKATRMNGKANLDHFLYIAATIEHHKDVVKSQNEPEDADLNKDPGSYISS